MGLAERIGPFITADVTGQAVGGIWKYVRLDRGEGCQVGLHVNMWSDD